MNSSLFGRTHRTKLKLGIVQDLNRKVLPQNERNETLGFFRVLETHFHDLCGVKTYLLQFLAGRGECNQKMNEKITQNLYSQDNITLKDSCPRRWLS